MSDSDTISGQVDESTHRLDQTAEAESRYVPKSRGRTGIALCLSGGGFRAAIFHLGALRRLNELGILSKIDTITSVSGGSIISAHLANQIPSWPDQATVMENWDERIAVPFRNFVKKDICTLPALKGWLPWNWFSSAVQVKALADRYFKRLTKLDMTELPEKPCFIFCATDLIFGVNWELSRQGVGDWQAGYAQPLPQLNVATAVAASSCFPPVFRPMPLPFPSDTLLNGDFKPDDARRKLNSKIRLTDGGIYDNMALEPVWKDHARVLVSDGGAPFRFKESKTLVNQIQRSIDVVGKQSVTLRKRWLISSYVKNIMQGAYWGIAGSPQRYGPSYAGYSKSLAWRSISAIRTDMNCFSDAEIAILENHGYLLAEAAIQQHEKDLISTNTPLSIPHPDWMAEDKIKKALANSPKRVTLKRFIDLFKI